MIPRLALGGHEAMAFDLPGHGADPTPVEDVTFSRYVESTVQAILSADTPAIVVGHSFGGAIARQAAARAPGRVRSIVSVASIWPPEGGTLLGCVDGLDPDYLAEILWAEDRRSARLSEAGVRRFAFFRCPPADIESALPLMTAEPVAPYETPLIFPELEIPHYYVECLQDRVIPIETQRRMHAGFPAGRTYQLDTDHGPFFSAPDEFARLLGGIAGRD